MSYSWSKLLNPLTQRRIKNKNSRDKINEDISYFTRGNVEGIPFFWSSKIA